MLGVNRQVYYRTIKSQEVQQSKAIAVVELVKEVRIRMPKIGTRKLYHILYSQLRELGVGRDRLFSILKANNMHIIAKRQYHITTNSYHRFYKHKNLIEHLEIIRPEQVWVSDITYIGNRRHPIYLSLVTDAYSKKIMGYNVSNSLNAFGAIAALKMAISNRNYKHDILIHHSDRGIQYCSNEYQYIIKRNKIRCSMTESYDPYQNAVAERVNGILKHEFINELVINDVELMRLFMKESIDIYNSERPHFSCHMHTPENMHKQRKVKIKSYKNKNISKNVFADV